MSEEIEAEIEEIEAMFVQVAHSMTRNRDRVTFHGLAPAILYFSDRPARVVGHMTPKEFIQAWGDGENSFAVDPPNAVVSFLERGDEVPEDAVVVLKDPGLEGDAISYTVAVLEGDLPARAESCSLFIDPLERPLSPGSLAGVHRRQRRRTRRL